MAVGGISQLINPVIDSIVSDRRSNAYHTSNYTPTRDTIPVKVLAIGDENCLKDQLLLCCAHNTVHLDDEKRAILKRAKYSDIRTQVFNVQCSIELMDTCEYVLTTVYSACK